MRPLIVDTDIGSDIDDALALLYLAKQSQVELVGVTTVTGEPRRRAAALIRLLDELRVPDVMVGVGADVALSGAALQPEALLLKNAVFDPVERYVSAVDVLCSVWDYPAQAVDLLCLAPLTNIAQAELTRPGTLARYRKVVLMGGQFSSVTRLVYPNVTDRPECEWNILCDVKAAQIVFGSEAEILCVPLDATHYVHYSRDEFSRLLPRMPESIQLQAAAHAAPWVILHDVVAAYALCCQEGFLMSQGQIHVSARGQTTMRSGVGHTAVLWSDGAHLRGVFEREALAVRAPIAFRPRRGAVVQPGQSAGY